jgi:ADP-heptose:LPS heptosyltransferase
VLVPDVERIAVLRCNGLGDLVFTLPAFAALKAAYPQAELVLLGRPWARELLGTRPSPVDRVVAVEHALDGSDPDPLDVGALRDEGFDLALQLHGGGRASNPFVNALGARVTAGSCTPDAERLDRWLPYVYLQPEVLRYLELVALVGAAPVGLAPELAVTDADRAAAGEVVPEDGLVAVLHPGSTDPRRRWPAEAFAAVGDGLAARGVTVLVSGGPGDGELVGAVLGAMRSEARTVSVGLGGLCGVLERAGVVVANDSGPLHLAAAVGTSTVGVFWGPNAVNSPPPWRAAHRPFAVLDLACSVCGRDALREGCGHDHSFVAPIRADEVLAAAEALLGLEPADPAAYARALDPRAAAASRAPVARVRGVG